MATTDNIDQMAQAIVDARREGRQTTFDGPSDGIDAMAVQGRVFEIYGRPHVGWKVGATNEAAQKGFGLDGPFYGPIADDVVLQSPATIAKTPGVGACEPEYAFRMKRAYPADGEDVNRETIRDAVDAVHGCIEVIGRALGGDNFANGVGVTMDFGGNVAFVVGPEIVDWQRQDLVRTEVAASVDGVVVQTGNGVPVMGDPLESLLWMARTLHERGEQLAQGAWVSTGTCTPPVPARAGSTVTATFGAFGTCTVAFT